MNVNIKIGFDSKNTIFIYTFLRNNYEKSHNIMINTTNFINFVSNHFDKNYILHFILQNKL